MDKLLFSDSLKVPDADPCPYCGKYHTRGKNAIFCSATCTALANTWRRKLTNNLARVCVLDFRLEFIDCVFPKLHIPQYLTRFYPQGETSFFLVPPGFGDGHMFQTLSIASVYDMIFDELGSHVAQFIREMNIKKSREDIHDYRKRFERWCADGLKSQETSFICSQCNNLYLDGQLTHWYSEFECEVCATKRDQPF